MSDNNTHTNSTPSLDLKIISWNCNRRNDPFIIQSLIKDSQPDILHIQEPQKDLSEKNTITYKNFTNWLNKNNYALIHANEYLITIINSITLDQHFSSPIHVSKNKRAATAVFYLDSINPLLISNVYAPHTKHTSYKTESIAIKNEFHTLRDTYPEAEHLVAGDINIDESNQKASTYNLLNFFKGTLLLKSAIPSFHEVHHPKQPLPPTHRNNNGSESHIDHILTSEARFVQHCQEAAIHREFTLNTADSDHDPITATFTFNITPSPEATDTPSINRHFNRIAAIPVYIPAADDEEAANMDLEPGWYHPHLTRIQAKEKEPTLELIQELHQSTTNKDFSPLINSIDRATNKLKAHAHTVHPDQIGLTLPPRTIDLQNEINTCYDLLTSMLNDTITEAFDNITTSKTKKKLSHHNLQAKISELYLKNKKSITKLLDISNGNPKKKREQFRKEAQSLTKNHNNLISLFKEQKDRCLELIDDYTTTATDIEIEKAMKRQKMNNDDSPSNTTNVQSPNPQNPSSSASPPNKTTTPKTTPAIHIENHKRVKETSKTLRSAFKKIQSHLTSLTSQLDTATQLIKQMQKQDKNMPQRIQILKSTLQPKYHTLKNKINDTLTVYNSAHINYNASFGQPKDLAQSIHQKIDPPLRANTHIPIPQGHHKAPKLIPAIGATERLEATKKTQQMQMAAPPGKALHFVTIKNDDVGPATIEVDLTKRFTPEDLASYHPAVAELDADTQTSIINAHNRFPELIRPLIIDTDNKSPYKWPFNFVTNPTTRQTTFEGPLQDLDKLARPTPSKARLNNFTINVLARMPRCWLQFTTSILQIILAARIIPSQLKTCGRILIDKPGSTDKRPISILHAFDAILDSAVATSLSKTIEAIDIFDDSILAYRKGRCSTDAVLNHLITVQDILNQHDPVTSRKVLAQFDLDQEKFFDRLTTELQLLPFHIAGFPDTGYIEWLAESLTGTIIITSTPFGKVECFFLCGTRQGATLSTITANMVGWLISIPWHTPHPDLKERPPGHTLAAVNDITSHNESDLTHDQQTFCDDASKYIVAGLTDIYKYLDHVLLVTSTMSIVTKLSINANKSSVRITGLDPNPITHRPSLTVWHHKTKSVKKTLIRTINMTTQPDSYYYKMFGVLIDKNGTPAKKQHTTLPQVRALTQSWKIGTISDRALVNHYPLYVTSVCNFAVLAKGFSLLSCRQVDHTTITNLLTNHFHLHPNIDSIHNIILPTKMAGFHFTGFLTTTVIDAYCRELLVLSNNPFPETINSVTARLTQALQNCYHSKSHTEEHLCPNALSQIALAGFYLRPTNMPLTNATISFVAAAHHDHKPFGMAPPIHYIAKHPFDHVLQKDNIKFSTHSRLYQDCIYLIHEGATKTPAQANLVPQYHCFLNETKHYPTSFKERPNHSPFYRIYPEIQKAVHSLLTQQQTLLTFYSPNSVLTVYDHHPPPFTTYLQDAPLPLDSLDKHLFQWQPLDSSTENMNDYFRQATDTIRTPDPNAHQDYARTTQVQLMHQAMHHATAELDCPIILSGDSSDSSKSPIITSVTFLVAIDFRQHPQPDWHQHIPIPLQYRAHPLPPQVGTMHTNNNMGEIHAATLALNTAPYDHPIIVILDSHITLHAIYLFFFPTTQSNREHIRSTYPANNTYYISELHEAIAKHWLYSKPISQIIHDHPHLSPACNNFKQITTMLAEEYGQNTYIDIKDWQRHHRHQPAKWSKSTKVLAYDNLLFVHVKSHQLTKTGEPKQHKTSNGSLRNIKVKPNRLFALMNSYADNICSRITKDPANHRHKPTPVPLPPITRLQNVIYHNGTIVTQPINNYIDTLLYNHALTRTQLHPLSWHLDILPRLHDPTSSIQKSDIRKEIVTTRAISHYRLLLTNTNYKSLFIQGTTNPEACLNTCPLCQHPNNNTADQFHHHYSCTNPTIKQARESSLTKIQQAESALQSLLTAIYHLIRPHKPESSIQDIHTLLLGALTATSEDSTLTPHDKQNIRRTGRIPARLQPTAAIQQTYPTPESIYMNPPSSTQKSSFTTISTLPMTGLLPADTHNIIRDYTSELIALTHHLFPTHKHHANELEQINRLIPQEWHIPTTQKTITAAFKQAWQKLLTELHQHPTAMQTTITKTILTNKDSRNPPPKKQRKKRSNSNKRKKQHHNDQTTKKQNTTKPCQGLRCKIRYEHGLPPTQSKQTICQECTQYNEALEAASKCIKSIKKDINTLTQSLRTLIPIYDCIDPSTTTTDETAALLTTTTIAQTDLSAALYPQLHPEITTTIHRDLNILPYQPDDEIQLELNTFTTTTLHFIAITLLLHLHPSSPPELPKPNTPATAITITKATTTCRCHPFRNPPAHSDNQPRYPQVCTTCTHLIQCAPTPNPSSNQDRFQCITCRKELDTYQYTDKPCLECMFEALLEQNKPSAWHNDHTKDLTNTIPSYFA